MFRRLAEFMNTDEGFQSENQHLNYIQGQNTYFSALPNIIPSSSGLTGLNSAIQSVEPNMQQYSTPILPAPDNIIMNDGSIELDRLSKECDTGTLDDLISAKNPNAPLGCGWMYTPPISGSPYPKVSRGALGDINGPYSKKEMTSDYKKWFFDLQEAKRVALLDKCKSLKNCSDLGESIYSDCGYCTDINQGIPIGKDGQPMYPDSPIGNCSPNSIITKKDKCPPPSSNLGPIPITNNVCDVINGRLSAMCLYNTVLSGGCSDKGALAVALNNASPNNYISDLHNAESVKIYNRVANPPLKLDIFRQGGATVTTVLQEVRQLASNANTQQRTQLSTAARDLCLQKGAINSFDFCADLPDTTPPPFDITCLQTLFKKLGGQPAGTAYPSEKTIQQYNTMQHLGAVKQYFNQLIINMKSVDYGIQRSALIQFLGITPEKIVKRVQPIQGIEVFWFIVAPGTNTPLGLLRRTIETDFPQFQQGDQSIIPQVGFVQYSSYLAITDVRSPKDFSVNWQVYSDDGFWISSNQPKKFDWYASQHTTEDSPGYFASNVIGSGQFNSKSCSSFSAKFPNIVKVFYQDGGGGAHSMQLQAIPCSGQSYMNSAYYSLTLEAKAPFISYEVNTETSTFEETRTPQIFSNFTTIRGLEYHIRSDEIQNVPGRKGFIRINSANSLVNIQNIAFQSWNTVTFAIRLQTMPVKETIFSFYSDKYYANIVAQPMNGNSAKLSIIHNFNGNQSVLSTPFIINIGSWYLVTVNKTNMTLNFKCNSFDNIIKNKGVDNMNISISSSPQNFYIVNGINAQGNPYSQSACYICFGTNGIMNWQGGVFSSSSFYYDLAWVHFFDYSLDTNDALKECMTKWEYTQYPDSYFTYNIMDVI